MKGPELPRMAALGMRRGRQPSSGNRIGLTEVNAENSSPLSETARFTGNGYRTSWTTAQSSTLSPNTENMSSRIRRHDVMSVRCKRIRLISSAFGCHGQVAHMPHTGQRRADSTGIDMPSKAQPTGSTSWLLGCEAPNPLKSSCCLQGEVPRVCCESVDKATGWMCEAWLDLKGKAVVIGRARTGVERCLMLSDGYEIRKS